MSGLFSCPRYLFDVAALGYKVLADKSTLFVCFGPSVDDQAVSLSDDGTTIIIDFFSFLFFLSFHRHSTRHTLHLHFNPD